MKAETMRKMLQDVLRELFVRGLYVPVISYDGQWAKLAFQDEAGGPLTMIELQKNVSIEIQKRSVKDICDMIFQVGIVKLATCTYDDIGSALDIEKQPTGYKVGLRSGQRVFRMTSNMIKWLQECRQQRKKPSNENETEKENVDDVLSNVSSEILSKLDETVFETIASVYSSTDNISPIQANVDISHLDPIGGSIHHATEMAITSEDDTEGLSQVINPFADQEQIDVNFEEDIGSNNEHTLMVGITPVHADCMSQMLRELQLSKEWSSKWDNKSITEFRETMSRKDLMVKFTKSELLFCYNVLKTIDRYAGLKICKSWSKTKIVNVLNEAITSGHITPSTSQRRHKNPQSLILLCRKAVRSLPKKVLNAIVAEYEFPDRVNAWRETSPFRTPTTVNGVGDIIWFSKPEFNQSNVSYVFSFLDPHHLLTNCRIKVCKDGFYQRGISRKAWMDVAKENTTNLKMSHVEDLVDKQSDTIAMATFSLDVEEAMLRLKYTKEAAFCRLIREFHEAEDAPGIAALERCQRRLNLREWLLHGVNFGQFPIYGSHIRGVPRIMFQGYLTNIDRRIQLYPYVKSGKYNVRSLGSLEAENFFGEFQDLDPKRSGVIKTEDIPTALEAACQMNHTRLMPDRPFHMTLSKAKVYPVNELLKPEGEDEAGLYIYPVSTNQISVRDHLFDNVVRSKRKAKRRLVTISAPDSAARGVAPVRQHHKCDESKILPHKRLGIILD